MVEQTKLLGDMGADLMLRRHNKKTVVQIKNHADNVGVKAMQEIAAAIRFYNADKGMVLISSYFTQLAMDLAKPNDIELVDRDILDELIQKYN